MKPVRENKLCIITCAYDIEVLLEQFIANYFFAADNSAGKRSEFVSQILTSSWCQFSSKRKLAAYVIEQEQMLQGNERNDYDQLLQKVMSIRNAFTHGALSTDGRKVKLSYFEGAPKQKFLTDGWLAEIEQTLGKCFSMSLNLSAQLSEVRDQKHPATS